MLSDQLNTHESDQALLAGAVLFGIASLHQILFKCRMCIFVGWRLKAAVSKSVILRMEGEDLIMTSTVSGNRSVALRFHVRRE